MGNPPYLGGQKLSGTYGYEFCEYVKYAFAPTGLSDLVVFFVRRIFNLLKPDGIASFITTNSIKDGDVRRDGLEQIVDKGGIINMAYNSLKWSGRANVYVSLLAFSRRNNLNRFIDGKPVSNITPMLDDATTYGEPNVQLDNINKMFQGYIFLGDGFLLSHEEADSLIREDHRNNDVIFKTVNGKEVTTEPDQTPQRSIINFHDWSLEKAKEYPIPFKIVEEKVKPFRQHSTIRSRRELFWIYASI